MDWQHFPSPSVPGSDFEVMRNNGRKVLKREILPVIVGV